MQRAWSLLFVVCLVVLAATTASAQDPVKVAPTRCTVVLENEYVRVLHWTEAPGDKTPMHEHPALVTITLTPVKTRMTLADGTTRETDGQAGQATWSAPEKHASEVLGTSNGEVIQVELKAQPGAALTEIPDGKDAVSVDPKHYSVVLQNDRVRVLQIRYGPGEKSVMHAHPGSVAVFLAGGQTTFTLPDGTTRKEDVKPGQVIWSDRQEHLPANTGGTPFELVLVELR